MKLFNYCPLEGKKFQLVCRVVEFSLGQTPPSVDYDCIHAVFMGLVVDSSQARPTSIGVELKGWVKSAFARVGAVVHSLFRLSKACWHLLSH